MPSLLVFLQFLLLAICFYPWTETYQVNWGVGLLILASFIGLYTLAHNRLGNFSIRPVYKPGGKLILSGPYQFFRHPMYVAVLLTSMGAVAMQLALIKVVFVVFLWIVLDAKARLEEKAMTEQFPEYDDYKANSSRWLPFLLKQKIESNSDEAELK